MHNISRLAAFCLLISGRLAFAEGTILPPSPPAYTGPGDVVSSATATYLLRPYTSAQALAQSQALINLRRTSDNVTCDVLASSDGSFGNGIIANCSSAANNGKGPSQFCVTTTGCVVVTWYDASLGSSVNITQATTANQPAFIFNCLNTDKPCEQYTSGSKSLSAAYTPGAATMTLSTVADRASGSGIVSFFRAAGTSNNNRITAAASANNWSLTGAASGSVTTAASDNAWHSAEGVVNGASSVLNVDGTESTGTTTGNTTAGNLQTNGAGSITVNLSEGLVYGSTLFTGTQRTNMCHNQRLYWGSGGSC